MTSADCIIIGGGFSGLLTALGVSRNPALRVVLVEAESKPGGRLLFSPRLVEVDLPSGREPNEGEALIGGAADSLLAGIPLDTLGSSACELWKTCRILLKEDEWVSFNRDVGFDASSGPEPVRESLAYVVKKEWTPAREVLEGPSETLTRKGAAHLKTLLENDRAQKPVRSEERAQASSAEHPTILRDSPIWKALSKAEKDELRPFLETVAGSEFDKARVSELRAALGFFVEEEAPAVPDTGRLALALVHVLRGRGVTLVFGAAVQAVRRETVTGGAEGSCRYVCKVQSGDPDVQTLVSPRLCVCVPLVRALHFLPREYLSPQESRFTMKVRPRSLIALEVQRPQKVPSWSRHPAAGLPARLLFPVERVLAIRTAGFSGEGAEHGSLAPSRYIFYAWLDYEVSLQAPGVREVLGRIKRAFYRIFPDCDLSIFARTAGKAGARSSNEAETSRSVLDLAEKLVLIPVAQSVPLDSEALRESPTVNERQGLFLPGEQYACFSGALSSVCASALAAAGVVSGDPAVSLATDAASSLDDQ